MYALIDPLAVPAAMRFAENSRGRGANKRKRKKIKLRRHDQINKPPRGHTTSSSTALRNRIHGNTVASVRVSTLKAK